MGRKVGIRWTKNQTEALKREIKNFNRRVRAAEARGIDKSLLPSTTTFKQEKARIKTIKEFNADIKRLAGATAKSLRINPQTGLTLYEDERNKIELREQRKRDKAKILTDIVGRYEQRLGRFPNERERIINELIKNYDGKVGEIIDKFNEWLTGTNLNRAILWKENYIKTIDANIESAISSGNTEGVKVLEELRRKIVKADIDEFLLGQLGSPAELSIGYFIPSPPAAGMTDEQTSEQNLAYQRLNEMWDKYIG